MSSGRYEQVEELGGGGMAVVYLARDTQTGRKLALKRPAPKGTPAQRRQILDLFAREFHTLAQLSHPRIVEVYDYAIDDVGPFYTMELLDGGDLQSLIPADYRRVCAIASDVCSGLSLLHSRRIVHRDVSPRNIRCALDGTAKLIDFGAMSPMGPTKELVGTPVYCAPEAVNMQPLDARTDLYALGATLYFALTSHHAYPVRDFAALPNAWRFGVARPSEHNPRIPEALDALVLDLLQLKPENRPSTAAEVMERLAAIEGRPVDEQLVVAQSYLTTPAFIGRESELARIRSKTMRAMRKRGSAALVEGVPGVGRSRFLDTCVLAGKLLGITVVRADADDAVQGEYGAMRAIVRQLMRAHPELTAQAAKADLLTLIHVVPELGAEQDLQPAAAHVAELRPRLQGALRQLFLSVAEQAPLMIAADDLHRFDEPSAAAIALLADRLRQTPMLIVATVDASSPQLSGSALRLFSERASRVSLQPLLESEVRTLLVSVFGSSSAIDSLARRAFGLSHGSPRDVLRLAQHLVDRGAVKYRGGAWTVPAQIDEADLPESIEQMLAGRVDDMSESARMLGCAFALCPECELTFEEAASVSEKDDPARTLADLEQLLKADALRAAGDRYTLNVRAFGRLLLEGIPADALARVHLRLAKLFEARGHNEFRVATHLLRGGDRERALDLLVAYATVSQEITGRSPEEFQKLILSLPEDWLQTYEEALQLCAALHRPPAQAYALRSRLAGIVAVVGVRDTVHIPVLISRLKARCGLEDWENADPTLEGMPRVIKALETTQARYDALPARERVLEPIEALRAIVRAEITLIGTALPRLDVAGLRELPSLAPFAVLSPALGIVSDVVKGVIARMTGRSDQARQIYVSLIERASTPEKAGMDPSHHRHMKALLMNGLAMIEAGLGLASSLAWADKIEPDALFQANAVLVRVVYHLWQGNTHEAEKLKALHEAIRVQNSNRQAFETTHLPWQVAAYAAMDELTQLKCTLDEVAPLAQEDVGWRPVLELARGEHQRVRGELAGARVTLAEALATTHAGEHQIWPFLAGALVRVIDEMNESAQAAKLGLEYLQAAEQAEQGYGMVYVLMPLCVAQARSGHPDAVANAERVIATMRALATTGLNLGLAYEARARVALAQNDQTAWALSSARCDEVYSASANPTLLAKSRRLQRDAQKKALVPPQTSLAPATQRSIAVTVLKSKLRACADAEARAKVALKVLAELSGASNGLLYWTSGDGPVCVATIGATEPTAAIQAMVREYIAGETHGHDVATGSEVETLVRPEWTAVGDSKYRPVLLSHRGDAGYAITGLAVFEVSADQRFTYPGEAAARLSRLAVENKDVTPIPRFDD